MIKHIGDRMGLKGVLVMTFILCTNLLISQNFNVEVILDKTTITKECHFGDDWSASFLINDQKENKKRSDEFTLKSRESFTLYSIIREGNETYNDFKKEGEEIQYNELKIGLNSRKIEVYVEDENKGSYPCNHATFIFEYSIRVSSK